MLRDKGAIVDYSDPYVPVFPRMREHSFNLSSIDLSPDKLAEYDIVLLATAHKAFDYAMLKQYARLIIDTRGIYHDAPAKHVIAA